ESAIRDFLLAHPEVIREALDPVRQLATKAQLLRAEILGTDGVPAAGDPLGAVTVVEFFDYGCGYCKRSATAVRETIAKSGVRVELRDYPILGSDSELASRLALAAGLQGRYTEAHFALMEREGGLGPAAAADLATKLGLDVTRLEEDMQSAEVSARIEANRTLGQRLGIRGTPVFLVVGPETVHVAPGAIDGARIAETIRAVN
ncbi:MAG: DsbA family protein, partial [Gammaproteobacteria bacterium]|nr:DsbA family protein [Gammaproteobacteria bacterium]